jgi:quinoprotein glucose dehydrogenase
MGLRRRLTSSLGFATTIGIALALLAMPAALRAQPIPGAQAESTNALSRGEWPAYAGTYASAH